MQRAIMDGVKFFSLCLPYGSKIMSLLGISILKPKETQFFYDVIKETLKIRREEEGKNAAKRNDLVGNFCSFLSGIDPICLRTWTKHPDWLKKNRQPIRLHIITLKVFLIGLTLGLSFLVFWWFCRRIMHGCVPSLSPVSLVLLHWSQTRD